MALFYSDFLWILGSQELNCLFNGSGNYSNIEFITINESSVTQKYHNDQ